MAVLPIAIYPDPILRRNCRPVTEFGGALARLAADLIETVHAAPGLGLAAPQVGAELRVAVIDVTVGEDTTQLHLLVNPEIVQAEGTQVESEGCLSLPELTEKVERPLKVRVRAQDLAGGLLEIEGEGMLARVLCHEIDHLNGILFVDRLRGLRRELAERRMRRLFGRDALLARHGTGGAG